MLTQIHPRFHITTSPIADPGAVIQIPGVRITLLTSRLFRMEYSSTGFFEDRASQAFWYRKQPVPHYTYFWSDSKLIIDTEYLHLEYVESSQGFTSNTLYIHIKTTDQTWHFGDHSWRSRNLMGTARTLDGINGQVDLGFGLNGRDGWAVVDDTQSLVFNQEGWLETRIHPDNIDLYFFGYGHDYVNSVCDFQKIAGATPLIPRYILGNWWSRYWAYSDTELLALMDEFKAHDVPLAVCIVDMDWHLTKTGNVSSGWTGYTWNRDLFPDPEKFITELHQRRLKTALNLHPASGVYPHEEQYQKMAEWMEFDTEKKDPVAFDITDPLFVEGYFNFLHHPYEHMGIDFWWMDWQQGTKSRIPGLDPLWWINHLHFLDLGRDHNKRSFVFSRWGGLGNHRYPIGFSGDTVISWESLANQPAFTSTAANVGYGWWSHDIGGHMGGIEDDELYTRWIQYGVFSPILRMHCTNNPFHERRPWARGTGNECAASDALRLRHQLIPYLYSMAWRNHQQGIPLITPLYYTHPEEDAAYECIWQEYWYGSELIAAPFTQAHDLDTGLSRQRMWFPEGEWYQFFNSEYVNGNDWHVMYGDIKNIPVYAKAGGIVPLNPDAGWTSVENPESLEIHVFAGASNQFTLYEDDCETINYQTGQYAITNIVFEWSENKAVILISPVAGNTSLIPAHRKISLVIHGIVKPDTYQVEINSQPINVISSYENGFELLRIEQIYLDPTDMLTVTILSLEDTMLSKRDRRSENLIKILKSLKIDTWLKAEIAKDIPKLISKEKNLNSYIGLKDAHISVIANVLHIY